MAASDHLRQLRAVTEIRQAQKQAADAQLADAEQGLGRQRRLLDEEQDAQADRGVAWATSVADGRLDLQLAWAHALHDGEAAVARARRAARRAEDRRDDARDVSRMAEARRQAAETVMTATARRTRRRAEEVAIATAEDLHSGRRPR